MLLPLLQNNLLGNSTSEGRIALDRALVSEVALRTDLLAKLASSSDIFALIRVTERRFSRGGGTIRMANTYLVGDIVRLTGAWVDIDGVSIDPTTVKLKIKDPFGVVTTLVYGTDVGLVRDATGSYHYDLSLTLARQWTYRFESTGTGQAAKEGTIVVAESAFAP